MPGSDLPEKERKLAFELGKAIAEQDVLLITGACPGYPFEAARGAASQGGLVIGISPGLSLWEHVNKYHSPTEHHDVLIFTGSGLMGREVVNIRSSDMVVIIGGKSGTLGEFAIAYDEGKLIGSPDGHRGHHHGNQAPRTGHSKGYRGQGALRPGPPAAYSTALELLPPGTLQASFLFPQ